MLTALLAVPSLGASAHAAGISHARVEHGKAKPRKPPKKQKLTPAQRRQREMLAQLRKKPTLILNSSFIRKAQAAGTVLPFTLRLRRIYEGGPGDDQLQLTWDASATPWPLTGTAPPAAPPVTYLDGAVTYEWDYRADTTGYSTLGTVETLLGGGVSMTAKPFQIATQETSTCTTAKSIDAIATSLTGAGVRFGTVNPYSHEASGTINLRTQILTRMTACDDTTADAVAPTTGADPPLPVAFDGQFTVSPGASTDGRIRFGVLTVTDSAQTPQRTTFGLVHACTDPAAADGCARKAFPVRTKLLSFTADVLVGDAMPPPPPSPPVAPPAPPASPSPPPAP